MNHVYIKIDKFYLHELKNEIDKFYLHELKKCINCGLCKNIYYNEITNKDECIFYYKGSSCSDDMNDCIEIDHELTCDEMIIKNIIE